MHVVRVMQGLSTYQLSPEQLAPTDARLDVITGFQLADGDLRMFVMEGLAQGQGMQQLVTAIAR
jgi:hypothetical protein